MKNLSKTRKKIVMVLILWGIVLAISGVINGNHAFNEPDTKELQQSVLQDKISSYSLNCRINNQRYDFLILEFANSNECSTNYTNLNAYSCFNEKSLSDVQWIRNAFKNTDKQLIVFGATPEKSLDAASTFKKYGYNVRMLDRNESVALGKPKEQLENSML